MKSNSFKNERGLFVPDKNCEIKLNPTTRAELDAGNYIYEVSGEREGQAVIDSFLHTASYDKFASDRTSILLGKTGEGKTSLLIFVEDYINEKKSKSGKWEEYDLAVYADFEESIKKLASFPEFHTTAEIWKLEYSIDDIITALIYIEIMREMEKQKFDVPRDVKAYLQSDSLRNIIDSLIMNPKMRDMSAPFNTLAVVWETLFTTNFDNAKKALKSYITNNEFNILVLIDSFDNYNMRTFECMTIVKQLIRQAFEFSINKKQTGINVKVAMPYEVYNGVLSPIIAKNQGNTTTLHWMYKELVRMVALKLCTSYKHGRLKGNDLFNFCEDFQLSDFYSDQGASSYVKSQELLHNILPERYKAILDFSLPTLMYAIRHTTLKPREVLYVFDQIIKTIIDKNDTLYFINTKPEEISIIVHKCMHHILSTILQMYNQTYNANQELNPKKIAQATLAKIKAVNPEEERIFEAFWILVFSIIQLLKDSMTCLTLETAVEKIESQ